MHEYDLNAQGEIEYEPFETLTQHRQVSAVDLQPNKEKNIFGHILGKRHTSELAAFDDELDFADDFADLMPEFSMQRTFKRQRFNTLNLD